MRAEDADVIFDRKAMLVRALDGLEDERPAKRKKYECRYCSRIFGTYDEKHYKIHEVKHLELMERPVPGRV